MNFLVFLANAVNSYIMEKVRGEHLGEVAGLGIFPSSHCYFPIGRLPGDGLNLDDDLV